MFLDRKWRRVFFFFSEKLWYKNSYGYEDSIGLGRENYVFILSLKDDDNVFRKKGFKIYVINPSVSTCYFRMGLE